MGSHCWVDNGKPSASERSPYLKLKEFIAAEAKERQSKGGKEKVSQNSDEPLRTDSTIANTAGVSRDTARKVEQVVENAIPEIQEMARANDISINAAATVANAPKAEQKKAAAAGVNGVKDLAKEMRDGKKKQEKKKSGGKFYHLKWRY